MTRRSRFLAAALLALMLPVQGWAAACAQICAQTQHLSGDGAVDHAAMGHAGHEAQDEASLAQDAGGAGGSHCGSSELGAGKCCQAHTFLVDATVLEIIGSHEHFAPVPSVARWVSFIPGRPHHPPIPASVIA